MDTHVAVETIAPERWCPRCRQIDTMLGSVCIHCGEILRDGPGVPQASLQAPAAQSPRQFMLLFLLTAGLYQIVWFYRAWHVIKRVDDIAVTPLLRALFCGFWMNDLFTRVLRLGQGGGYNATQSPLTMAILWFATGLGSNACYRGDQPAVGVVLTLLQGVVMLPAVKALAAYRQAEQNTSAYRKLSGWDILLIVVLGLFWMLALLGTLLPDK
jgi:hypothetical protein